MKITVTVEVYRKYDGIVGTAKFTEQDIINMREEHEEKFVNIGYQLENGVKGFSPQCGDYDGIIVNNSFGEIYNGKKYHKEEEEEKESKKNISKNRTLIYNDGKWETKIELNGVHILNLNKYEDTKKSTSRATFQRNRKFLWEKIEICLENSFLNFNRDFDYLQGFLTGICMGKGIDYNEYFTEIDFQMTF